MKVAPALLLNVDDDDAARYVKSRILKMAGFEVLEAANGAAALKIIHERSPDLVLLDVKLPDINGRDLCAQIKSEPTTSQIVVLQTSASHIDMRHRVMSLDAGADGYLIAPMEPEELVANVRALLRMRRAEHERQKALEALREADRRKDEFLAMLAHELRNPLAPIRNAVEILRISEARPVRERARELIGRQVQHMARLVDDLLEVSRITQRKVVLQRSVVKLATILDSAIEVVRPVLESLDHKLVVSAPEGDVWLDVDAVRLSQVVGNLLHNAAKFTPHGGRIALEVSAGPEVLEIRVSDDGVGMAPEVLPTVFELFSQADRSLERSQGGLGIGLSLVKGLVEMHGGTVSAESAGPNKGSTFSIRLPMAKLLAQPPANPASGKRAAASSLRILVVEDNEDAAEAMMLLLTGIGHEVTVVSDGREAVGVARRVQPEVILLDIGLPGMDGYELARVLRDMPETHAARLIAVSGYGQQKDRARSREAGFDVHLVKPVDPSKLTEAINAAA
jgi:two-component system, sensor histidine kinase